MFFRFASGIKGVRRIGGSGDSILLHISARPSQESLRDLIALFHRYQISGMTQLAQFCTDANRDWFADPKAFWHRKIFRRLSVRSPNQPSGGDIHHVDHQILRHRESVVRRAVRCLP